MGNMTDVYKALDIKHTELVKHLCPETVLDGVTWYDSQGQYLEDTRVYLNARGILLHHPIDRSLWRFQ